MGRYDLGLAEQEFWNLTLAELDALIDRREADHLVKNLRAGMICATIANRFRSSEEKVYMPGDFLQCPKVEEHVQTPEEMLEVIKQWQTYFEVTNNG